MKLGLWILILAVTTWSLDRDQWMASALAASVTNTNVSTTTSVRTNGTVVTTSVSTVTTTTVAAGPSTNTSTSQTDTNCHASGTNYGGSQWAYCNRGDPNQQRNTQDDTKDLNDKGAGKSSMLGMAAIAAGMGMVAAGMSMLSNPPSVPAGQALIAAGTALMGLGALAMAAAAKMNNNADKAGTNANKMDNYNTPDQSTISDGSGGKSAVGVSSLGESGTNELGDGGTGGIKIDPALLRTGKLDNILADMESKTGISRDDLAASLIAGRTPAEILAGSPNLAGNPAASAANLQGMIDGATLRGLPSAQDAMAQLGLNADDLVVPGAGGDKNRGLASSGIPSLESLFPSRDSTAGPPATNAGPQNGGADGKLSREVQAALDRNGITARSLFEMVHAQYTKKAPVLFGLPKNKLDGTATNPYAGLGGEKIDFEK